MLIDIQKQQVVEKNHAKGLFQPLNFPLNRFKQFCLINSIVIDI